MKINQIINIAIFVPNLQSGGSERMAINISNELKKHFQIKLIIIDDYDYSYPSDCEIISISNNLKKKRSIQVVNFIHKMLAFRKIIKINNINFIIALTNTANNYLPFISRNIVRVASCRGFNYLKKHHRKYRFFQILGIEFLFNSKEMMFFYREKYGSSKTFYLPNFIQHEEVDLKSKELIEDPKLKKIFEENRVIVNLGQFSKIKAQHNLIKIFNMLRLEFDNIKLVFIGHRGEYENFTKILSKESQFCDDIIFIGYTNNPFKYLVKSYIMCHTSINEGFPNALLESMFLGLPVISTNCKTGPSELINTKNVSFDSNNFLETKNGILSPVINDTNPFDLKEVSREHIIYKDAIRYLLNDEITHKAISINSKKTAKYFEKANVSSLYIDYIKNLFFKGEKLK